MVRHPDGRLLAATTLLCGLLLGAACSGSTVQVSDAGCATGPTCQLGTDCPSQACTCSVVGTLDAGGEHQMTITIAGSCTDSCCAPCPPFCS